MAAGSQAAAAQAAAAAGKAKAATPTKVATPAVIAKPTAPTFSQSLNLYGSPASGGYSGIPLTPAKPATNKAPTVGKTTGSTNTFIPGYTGPNTTGGGGGVDVTGGSARPSTRTPVYDGKGKLIGYNVTNYNLDGSIASVTFEPVAAEEEVLGTTNIQVLKSMLIATGLSAALVEGSTTFLQSLLKDGLSEESAVEIYLNNKEFTTKTGTVLTSPFYSAYGFYNDALTKKLSASDLFNTVEGYKSTQTKYNLDAKFTSQEYIQKYLKNNISVATLDKNANKARLAAVTADPLIISNLQQLGYIGSNADLTDFYLDPNIGMEKMQQNFNTAALSFEAVRRANTGITFNKANFEKLGADLTAKGYDETQAQYVAGQAYNVIGQTLKPEVGLSNIYEGKQAADAATIQSELEQEQLNSIESLRRKKLIELETRSFQGQTGNFTGRTASTSNYSSAGQI
jgi:hypothetical protein